MSSLFLKIVNMSIAAGWLILAVIALRFLLKKAPKWSICLLWALAAVRLVFPFSIESILSLIPNAETVPANIEMMPEPAIDSGIGAINEVVNPVVGSFAPDPNMATSINPLQAVIPLLCILWIAGIAIMLLYALISYRKLKKSVAASVPAGEGVMICDELSSPFILGLFRPMIYLPSSMEGETRAYVLAHERAHIRRRDHLWKPLGFLLLAVYWFNPLCWIAYILLCRDIEAACDEKVIRNMDKDAMAAYSQALLDCSFPRKRIAACPLAFGEVGVKERVKGVLNYKKPAFWIILLAVIACIAVAVCFLTNPKKNEEPEMQRTVFVAEIMKIEGDLMYVTPQAGSAEARSCSNIEVSVKNIEPAGTVPEAGDLVQIEYDGYILEVYPARLNEVYSVRLLKTMPEMDRLRAMYPKYFGLPADKGLEVYVSQFAKGDYYCNLLPADPERTAQETIMEIIAQLGPCSMDDMRKILSAYDVPEDKIAVIAYRNPISSYSWPGFDLETDSKRLRELLFD
ncbi:MAG: hypothetical protein IJK77_02715 [Lachnospiraceae bacterium]|nr:hypothetical protein [Lachnospiraceae bacterium]